MEMEPKDTSFEVFSHIKKHYYGDTVRRFFFTGDVIMLLTLAFFRDRANFPIVLSIFAMVLIGFLAGFINPKQKIIIFFNFLVSLLAFGFFEFYAVNYYTNWKDFFFLTNQLLALIFFIALYYSTKTYRGSLLS